MRTLIINMLAAALLLFGASSASAFSINHTTNYDGFSELEVTPSRANPSNSEMCSMGERLW